MGKLTNLELWNAIRKNNAQFAAHTSEGTAELFTERGFDSLTKLNADIVNEFFKLAMPFYLNLMTPARAVDRLEVAGFGETYADMQGGDAIQRIAIGSMKPVSPAYRNLKDGDAPDPYIVRKPVTNDRFWRMNFDYQNFVTMPDEWTVKRLFIATYGIDEFMSGIFQGLDNGYILQAYLNKLEALNAALNSTTHPLQASQSYDVALSEQPTAEELVNFQRSIMNVIELMNTAAQTGAYNAMGFESVQDTGRLKLLVRSGYKTNLALDVVRGSYNADTLNLGVDIITVPHFGGLKPYKESTFTTPLYPVYDKVGAEIGFNEAEDQTEVTVENKDVFWKDPNADTVAVLADKGAVFHIRNNEYSVRPIYNPRGLYTNYWASSPNNAVCYDPLFNFVRFKNVGAAAAAATMKTRKA